MPVDPHTHGESRAGTHAAQDRGLPPAPPISTTQVRLCAATDLVMLHTVASACEELTSCRMDAAVALLAANAVCTISSAGLDADE